MNKKDRAKHWSNYWQAGLLTSLPQDFRENYDGSVRAQWHSIFDNLGLNSVVLDLCTGNCAIALLAADYSVRAHKKFRILAVDAADVSKQAILSRFPNQAQNLAQIDIIPNCRVEEIDLGHAQFDLITSQYGVEYCDWALAAKKISELLKPGGVFSMISHTGNTEIVKYMQHEKESYEFLFASGVFRAIQEYLGNKISYRVFITHLKNSQSRLGDHLLGNSSPLLVSVSQELKNITQTNKSNMEKHKPELKHLARQHKYAFARLQDLFRVTKAIVENPDWHEVFIQHGLTLRLRRSLTQADGHDLGVLFSFEKGA